MLLSSLPLSPSHWQFWQIIYFKMYAREYEQYQKLCEHQEILNNFFLWYILLVVEWTGCYTSYSNLYPIYIPLLSVGHFSFIAGEVNDLTNCIFLRLLFRFVISTDITSTCYCLQFTFQEMILKNYMFRSSSMAFYNCPMFSDSTLFSPKFIRWGHF